MSLKAFAALGLMTSAIFELTSTRISAGPPFDDLFHGTSRLRELCFRDEDQLHRILDELGSQYCMTSSAWNKCLPPTVVGFYPPDQLGCSMGGSLGKYVR
jgi:hypothetical protein